MAKLPTLVKALATVDDRGEKTIDYFARTIREAGYIPTTRRGSGASDMTAREAANLLIALHGADDPKGAGLAIDRFRSLKLRGPGRNETDWPVLADVKGAANFGEALEILIGGGGTIAAYLTKFLLLGHKDDPEEWRSFQIKELLRGNGRKSNITLRVTLQKYWAEIEIEAQVGTSFHDIQHPVLFHAEYLVDSDRLIEGFYGSYGGDRVVKSSFGLPTVFALWRALAPDNPDNEAGAE